LECTDTNKNTKNCAFLKTVHVWELFRYKLFMWLQTDDWYSFEHNVSNIKSKGTHAMVRIILETGLSYLWTYSILTKAQQMGNIYTDYSPNTDVLTLLKYWHS